MNNPSPKLSTPQQASADGRRHIAPKLSEMQFAVMAFLCMQGERGATDSEIEYALGIGDNARKRRGELCAQGMVSHSTRRRRRCNAFGQAVGQTLQTVWFAAEAAPPKDVEPEGPTEYQEAIKELTRTLRAAKRLAKADEVSGDALFVAHGKIADNFARYVEAYYAYQPTLGGSYAPF